MIWKCLAVSASLLSAAMLAPSPAAAVETNVMVIFDASGSMKRPAGNETRISAAKRIVSDTLATMPGHVRTGLLVYGHRRAKDCSDMEVVSPIGADDSRTQARMVQGVDALGETPIADALDRAGQSMKAFAGQNNSIVLVTDGIEECRGDPCAAADRLSALGIGVKVHVVGFALQPGESSSLQCVVDKTGGRYFDARDADALKRTFAEVRQIVVAQTSQTQTPAPKAKVYFEDPFDGTKLGELWDVANKKDANFGVEKGELLTMVTGEAGFRHAPSPNRFLLKKELPGGDWDLVLDMRAEFNTGRDGAWLGVYKDDKNFLGAYLWANTGFCSEFVVSIIKRTDGEEAVFNKRVAGSTTCGFGKEDVPATLKKFAEKGGKLVLSKRGRQYTASAVMNPGILSDRTVETTTDAVSVLRLSGDPALMVGQHEARKGETLLYADKFSILAYD